jgi:hypothetical protein
MPYPRLHSSGHSLNLFQNYLLNSIDTATLIGTLRASLEEAVGQPAAGSMGLPGMKWVQYGENEETVFFRVFLSDRVFHEYPVPKNTTLATELKAFGDRVEARNLAKVTNPQPDSPSGKLN